MTLHELERLQKRSAAASNRYVRALTSADVTPEFLDCLKRESDQASREYTEAWDIYNAQERQKVRTK